METIKISNTEIEVSKTIPEVVVTQKYERGFIEEQIVQITKQRDEYVAQREAELAECESILAEMDKLDIVKKEDVIKEVVDNEVAINEIDVV